MLLEKQVVYLNLAKKMLQCGWTSKTAFVWVKCEDVKKAIMFGEDVDDYVLLLSGDYMINDFKEDTVFIPAPTAEEILDILPKFIHTEDGECWLHMSPVRVDNKGIPLYIAGYEGAGFGYLKNGDSLADALGNLYNLLSEKDK